MRIISRQKQMMSMKYFSIDELTHSSIASARGIDNTPRSREVVDNMVRLVSMALDPAREALGSPITVNSGYRCPELNRAVGGVPSSYHLQGRAADLTTGSVAGNRRLMAILGTLPHRELIWERGGRWVHVAI